MKPALKMMLTAAVLAAAVVGSYKFGQYHSSNDTAASSDPGMSADTGTADSKILYYRNPMGLPDTSPVPKKDSMGMDYIPVYAGDEPDNGVVKVNPARLQTLGVKTAVAEMRVLDAEVRSVGRIEVNERAIHDISPRFEGWIERLYVNAVGDPVRRGQPLFSVYSPELLSAQKELQIAEQLKLDGPGVDNDARQAAQRLAAAARERLSNWQVATDGKASDRMVFTSPVNGIVLDMKAVQGMRFMSGTAIYRIADLSTVWVIADVYEKDLAQVKVGEPATVTIDAYPDRQFKACISYLYPTLNASTRTTSVRLVLENRDGLLRPGLFAHVDMSTAGNLPRLTVPRSAVIDTGERQVVLRVLGDGRFKPQPIKAGLRGEDDIEVLEGLQAGDEVVVAANFLIDAESNLKAALATFTEPAASAPSAKTYEAVGKIEAVDKADNSLTMTHEPIPALSWPAMTMDFGVEPALLETIAPGEQVNFTFEDRGDGDFVIVRVEPAAKGGP